MLPSVSFVIPTWNRAHTLEQCIETLVNQDYSGPISVLVVDDQSTDNTVGLVERWQTLAKDHQFPREVKLQFGPGRSNWRPGAIHRPFFEHALTCKAEYVGYQFSDDYSSYNRVRLQVGEMQMRQKYWSYCRETKFVDLNGNVKSRKSHDFVRSRDMQASTGPLLPVYGFLVNRRKFIDAGGCDYPLHAGANAEAWISIHCGMTSDPVIVDCPMFFRVHEEALGNKQKPGSSTYRESTSITGFVEEDHWALWAKIQDVYNLRAHQARF